MRAADYLLCGDCSCKLYYRNEAGSPDDELPDGAVLFCGDCAARRVLSSSAVVVVATTEAAAGFQKRAEWMVEETPHEWPQDYVDSAYGGQREYAYSSSPTRYEATADRQLAEAMRHSAPARKLRRNVYEGPWEATNA